MSTEVNVLIALAVVALLLWRQMRKRRVREDRRPVILLVLLVLGVLQLTTFLKTTPVSAGVVALLAGSLALAAGFGVVRGHTMRLWREDGDLWRQGTWLTVMLWVTSIGSHLGLDYLIEGAGTKGVGTGSVLLYLAVTLGAQRLAVQSRANRLVRV